MRSRPGAPSVLTLTRDVPGIRFLVASGDPRDLLDAGADLLLTRDPATLDYAATLPHFQSVPLAWQRTHVLLSTRIVPPRHRRCPRTHDGPGQRRRPRGGAGAQGPSGGRPRRVATSPSHRLELNRRSVRESSMTQTMARRAISPSASSAWPAPRVPRGGVPRCAASRSSERTYRARHRA